MAFTLAIRDIKMTMATASGNEQDYRMEFVVISDVASDVVAVTAWLPGKLPVDLNTAPASYGNSDAELQSFTVDPADDKAPKHFTGIATYQKKPQEHRFISFWVTGEVSIGFSSNTYERVLWKARNSKNKTVAVLNSAGDPFAEPVVEVEKRLVINIGKTYTYSSWGAASTARYFDSVNSNAITVAGVSIPARGGWMQTLSPQPDEDRLGNLRWRVGFAIEVKGHGNKYDREVLDQGFSYLVADSNGDVLKNGTKYRRQPVMSLNPQNGEMERVTDPVLLDGDGGLLANTTPGNEKYLTYRTKPEKPWGSLGLPRSLSDATGI